MDVDRNPERKQRVIDASRKNWAIEYIKPAKKILPEVAKKPPEKGKPGKKKPESKKLLPDEVDDEE